MRHCAPLALAVACATPAAALDLPARKVGLWEMTMAMDGGHGLPPQASQHCIDAETDKLMQSMGSGMQKEMCSKHEITQVGNTYVIDAVCTFGPIKTISRGVVSGDFNSAYTVKTTSKREGGPAIPGMPAETSMTVEAKWLSACKADQKPGDIIMADGRKMNIRDMQNLPAMLQGARPPAQKK